MNFLKRIWHSIVLFFVTIGRYVRKIWRSLRYVKVRSGHKKRIKRAKPPYAHCYNCGQELRGMYCHNCGQYARDISPSFFTFIKQYFENSFQWDGKFFLTFRELFAHPGRLSVAFAQGHVARYVFPLKIYMFVMVIFGFVTLASVERMSKVAQDPVEIAYITAQDKEMIYHLKASHALDSAQTARVEDVVTTWGAEADKQQQFVLNSIDTFLSRLPFAFMFAMPFFAFLTRGFFRRRYKRYIPHFVYAIHLHTAMFIVMIFALPMFNKFDFDSELGWVIGAWFTWYSLLAARRFFGSSWVGTFFKNLGVMVLYFLFCVFLLVLFFLISAYYDTLISGTDWRQVINID